MELIMNTKKWLAVVFIMLLALFTISATSYMTDVIVISPDGVWFDTRAYSTIDQAITAVGTSNRDIYIVRQEATTNLTINANTRLHFFKTGSIANTGQLTINTTNISAPDAQIFTGTGDIDFANGTKVRSAWFEDVVDAFDLTNDDHVTLVISKQDNIDANCTQGDNVYLEWESPRNRLIVDSGFTLSNIHSITSCHYQLFAGS